MGLHTEVRWAAEPDVQAWLDASRLNVVKDLASTADHDELRDLQGRFLTALFPALERLRAFRAVARPAEQQLIFYPLSPSLITSHPYHQLCPPYR